MKTKFIFLAVACSTFLHPFSHAATTVTLSPSTPSPVGQSEEEAGRGRGSNNATKDFLHETPAEREARMAWFNNARFGMFIHWGVYSVPAGEYEGKTNYGEWFMEETKIPVSQYESLLNNSTL